MSITRRIFFGAAASWFSRGLTILLGLVLMPVLFRMLGKEELGLWLLLGQSAAVLGVLDFGFGVTLTRRLAFAKGKSGSDPAAVLGEESRTDIADLVSTGLRIYRVLAVVAFVVSMGLGLIYLRSLDIETIPISTVWIAWAAICLSQAMTVWATPWTCLLQGVGYVGWDAIIASFTGALTLAAQIVAVLLGGGIVTLGTIAAIGALLQRATILGFAKRKQPTLFNLHGTWSRDLFLEMIPFAWRAWLTAVGYIVLSNSDQLFISSFIGEEELPPYRAAFVLLINLHFASGVFSSASTVFVSHLWERGEVSQIRELLRRNSLIGLLCMGCGGAAILALGSDLFDLWLGVGNYIGAPIITTILLTFILEHLANVFATIGRATNDEAYAWSSLAGAGLKIVLCYALVKHFGLLGVALSTLVAQGVTNTWYMIYRTAKRVEINLATYFTKIALPIALISIGVYLIGNHLTTSLPHWNAAGRTILVVLISSLSLAVSLWYLVLGANQRLRLFNWIKHSRS